MTTRNVNLTDMLDRFVEDRVESGAYQNASEVVRAGLRLLQAQTDEQALKLERLRAAIREGMTDIARGESDVVELDELESWMNERGQRTEL
jgi:antitoxin ParD1/3/4